MPTSKNALLRYLTLDKCFQRGDCCVIDLLDECNDALMNDANLNGTKPESVSRRQIEQDIKLMIRQWNIPLTKKQVGHRVYYSYSDPHYSLRSNPLSETEVKELKEVSKALGRFRGMPNFEWISETLVRLGEKLGVDQQGEGYYIEFDHNRDYVGSQYLEPLLKYIINKTPIKIDYKPFKYPNNVQWIIHPYFLKQYNGRWFLLGWKEDAGDGSPKGMMTLGLERICAMPIPASVEYIPTDVDFSAYFEDVIGVSIYKDSIMINLKLKFSEKRYPYVVTKPIYPYQKTNDEERTLQMLIIPNHELDTLILSFGRDVEVLSPMEYRDHIKSILSDALDKYSKCEE